jgi:hypothetical protein
MHIAGDAFVITRSVHSIVWAIETWLGREPQMLPCPRLEHFRGAVFLREFAKNCHELPIIDLITTHCNQGKIFRPPCTSYLGFGTLCGSLGAHFCFL